MTPSQKQRAIKLLKPLIMEVKRELTENTGISKKFTSFDTMPPVNVQLFLISKADSTYAVGYFDPATNKLIDVSTPHRKYNSVDISHFRYWAT